MTVTRVLFLAGLGGLVLAAPSAAQCDPDGDIQFVCGPVSPEDLVLVPDAPWVLAAGMEDDGYLYAIDTRTLDSAVLFPTATYGSRPDPIFGACSGPVTGGFRPHGLSLRPGTNGRHTLYVVRHGAREAIEVFEVDARFGAAEVDLAGVRRSARGGDVQLGDGVARSRLRGDALQPAARRALGVAAR